MKVGIYTNTQKDSGLKTTRSLVEQLKSSGIDFCVENSIAEFGNAYSLSNMISAIDYLIVVGGDGTILNVITECATKNVPILGLNLGTIGFLTEAELCELSLIVDSLVSNSFTLDSRRLLRASFNGKDFYALNEVLISRSDEYYLVNYEVSIGDSVINNYTADGFIMSSPTGSTAYSLSCGGPILSPHVKAMVLVPVNPHSLMSRAIVVGDNEVARLKLISSRSKGNVVLDGRLVGQLVYNDEVEVSFSDAFVQFVRLRKQNFYTRLFEKLDIWNRRK